MSSNEEHEIWKLGYEKGYITAIAKLREILAKHELQYKLNLNKENKHD